MSDIDAFFGLNPHCVLVTIEKASGSTPREAKTQMLVSDKNIFGTIGGGQLEYLAIDEAHRMLRTGVNSKSDKIVLGPDLGQCCGGSVTLGFVEMDEVAKQSFKVQLNSEIASMPRVYVFGAGHVGKALVAALSLLPLQTTIVETRETELATIETLYAGKEKVTCLHTAIPETVIAKAPSGSAFIVLTHDHALDYLITAAALKKDDAAYVGLIGSKTKRELFNRFYLENSGAVEDLVRLTCPIGAGLDDKRPEIIAAYTVAELLTKLSVDIVAPQPA